MNENTATIDIDHIQFTSLAAPSEADIALFRSLSDDEQRAVLDRELAKGRASGLSNRSMDDLWQEAIRRTGQLPDYAL